MDDAISRAATDLVSPRTSHAPVVFFGYNRAEHAVRALESFKACAEADATPLVIYMDGPKSEAGAAAVEAARDAVREAAPRHARIVLRDDNLGLAQSIRTGVTEVCAEYGRVIVVEDDLVLSPAALTYFNAALDRYAEDRRVMHIAGYWPDTGAETLPPSFFIRWPSVWGWATWQRAWDLFEWDLQVLKDRLESEWMVDRFNQGGWNFFENLVGTLQGRYDSWGIRWYASVLLARGLALHPAKSLVSNVGTDGSGVHLDVTRTFDVALSDAVPEFPDEVRECEAAVRAWAAFNRRRTAQSAPASLLRRGRRMARMLSGRLLGGGGPTTLPARLARRVRRYTRQPPRAICLITGAPRSGTTAVGDWLQQQPGFSGAAESRVLVAAHSTLGIVDRFHSLYQRRNRWHRNVRRLILDAYTDLGVSYAGQVLIDKEPLEPVAFPDRDYEAFLRHARAALRELQILYMVRDPVATIWSMTRREWGFSRRDVQPAAFPLETHLQTWLDCARLALKLRNDPRSYVCRYEHLVASPVEESRRIASFLGLSHLTPFEPRRPDDVGFGSEEREKILTATAELRSALGM